MTAQKATPRIVLRRTLIALAIAALALGLRAWAVAELPIDYDEDDYLRAAQEYAAAFQAGDPGGLLRYNYRPEHPPLAKIAFGVAIAPLPAAALISDAATDSAPAPSLPQPQFTVARDTSAAFGTLEVLALALYNPLAAVLLGVHTWTIKYTSQVMIEALPSLASALAVLCYVRAKAQWNRWLVLSAVCLGITAASKYLYVVAGIAIVAHWLGATFPAPPRTPGALAGWLRPVVLWGLLAVAVFFAADPYLWPDPIARLKESLLFHSAYAQSEHVQSAGYPPWQPLVWIFSSVPWHPTAFFVLLDFPIAVFATLGLPRLWERRQVFAIWLIVALSFLLVWPTKWPQYILILSVPLTLAAAEGLGQVRDWLRPQTRFRPRTTKGAP